MNTDRGNIQWWLRFSTWVSMRCLLFEFSLAVALSAMALLSLTGCAFHLMTAMAFILVIGLSWCWGYFIFPSVLITVEPYKDDNNKTFSAVAAVSILYNGRRIDLNCSQLPSQARLFFTGIAEYDIYAFANKCPKKKSGQEEKEVECSGKVHISFYETRMQSAIIRLSSLNKCYGKD